MMRRSPGCAARSAAEMVVKWPRTVVAVLSTMSEGSVRL